MRDFNYLKRNLKKDFSGMNTIKCAIVADSSVQLLTQAIRGQGYEDGLNIIISDYSIDDVFNQSAAFYTDHDYVILFLSVEKLQEAFYRTREKESFFQVQQEKYQNVISHLKGSKARILIYTLGEINDGLWGNYANRTPNAFLYHLREINEGLRVLAKTEDISLIDFNLLQLNLGADHFHDPKLYIAADMVLSVDSLPLIAKSTVDVIKAGLGKSYKCVVLDLDNTLWGGIIGEDGLEKIQIGDLGIGKAYSLFQLWLKQLKERGILLAVCSKNDEELALQAFDHPEMVLEKDDFAVFVANWENKADNIQYIRSVLNIGFDSMIFVDDSAFERNLLREMLPEVFVPEMPADTAEYVSFLASLNLFETVTLSENDTERTKQYQDEALRKTASVNFTDYKDYLKSLEMKALIKQPDAFSLPRIAQLATRANQFNLRTVRYSESDLERLTLTGDYETLSVSLEDKFGDYGLIAYIVLKEQNKQSVFIENWAMSCRVLQRGVEDLILNEVVKKLAKLGYSELLGEYLPSTKNSLVTDLYARLGFEKDGNLWKLSLINYLPKAHFINLG